MAAPLITTSSQTKSSQLWRPKSEEEWLWTLLKHHSAAEKSLQARDYILLECKHDPVYWINTFVMTYDPRRKPSKIPMQLFPRQEEYIRWRRRIRMEKKHGLVEKSRDMGATWLNALDQLHAWLFEEDFKGSIGSRKEGLVDDLGNPDTIMEKMRMVLRDLPGWMLPLGYREKDHAARLRFVNPITGSTITGEGGDNMGRGGRSTVYDVDEAAFIEHAEMVDAAISNNTDVIFYTSTPHGLNHFYQKRVSGRLEVFTLHWRDHPLKDEDWYERMAGLLDPVTLAQEVDIDYAASVSGVIIPRQWTLEAVDRPTLDDDRDGFIIAGDVAELGDDSSAMLLRIGPNIEHLEEWWGHELEETAGRFIRFGHEVEERYGLIKPGHPNHGQKLYFMLGREGVGAGVVSHLRAYVKNEELEGRWVILGINVGEKSREADQEKRRFKNLKAQLWWRMREYFEQMEPGMNQEIPRALRDKLAMELSTPTYEIDEHGWVAVEEKKKLRKRGVRSPNLAEALSHSFGMVAMKQESKPKRRYQRQARGGMVV